jgi:hypothetical protein
MRWRKHHGDDEDDRDAEREQDKHTKGNAALHERRRNPPATRRIKATGSTAKGPEPRVASAESLEIR